MKPSPASTPMSPEELLDAAVFLTEAEDPGTAGLWPRAAAFLARQALEGAMARLWATKAPGTEAVSKKAQLLCLTAFVDEEVAERASLAWWGLTRACHHHAYELGPTEEELRPHFRAVESLLRAC